MKQDKTETVPSFDDYDGLLAVKEGQDQIKLELTQVFDCAPGHVAELEDAVDLGCRMVAPQSQLPCPHINQVEIAFNEGRFFQNALETAVADFVAKVRDTPANRRRATSLCWEFVERLGVPAVRLKVRIHRRFGDSPLRVELSKNFGIGDISTLVVCSDEVVRLAIDAKKQKPDGFSRAMLQKLIRNAMGEKAT